MEVGSDGDEDEGGAEAGGALLQHFDAERRAQIGRYADGTKAKRLLGRGAAAAARRRARHAKVVQRAAPGAREVASELLREAKDEGLGLDGAGLSEESDDDYYFD